MTGTLPSARAIFIAATRAPGVLAMCCRPRRGKPALKISMRRVGVGVLGTRYCEFALHPPQSCRALRAAAGAWIGEDTCAQRNRTATPKGEEENYPPKVSPKSSPIITSVWEQSASAYLVPVRTP
eukprot:CAMPEP_0173322110 /NCGR_PEP_ID=MMETSP1143-20121109/29786_1 /TAXON_ID=483371 /ORGANISM="non described non described, Strain CCMP2298" /LENGTH=124 /DNA_ID=CAMNT_0014265941 /DNA_START=281 /DNA_END=655 /DNA_ORIENTATION=+